MWLCNVDRRRQWLVVFVLVEVVLLISCGRSWENFENEFSQPQPK
jgi:hypothetical protein